MKLAVLACLTLLAAACSSAPEETAPTEPVACATAYRHQRVGFVDGAGEDIRGLVASQAYDDVLWLARATEEGPEIVAMTPTGQPISGLLLGGLANVVENITVGADRIGSPALYLIGAEDDRGNEPVLIEVDEIDPYGAGTEPTARIFELGMPNETNPVALAVDPLTNDLLIASQERATTVIYRLPTPTEDGGLLEPETVASIDTGVWPILDIDVSTDGARIAMRTRSELWLWGRATDQPLLRALATPVCVSSLPREGQGATVIANDGDLEYVAVGITTPSRLEVHRPTLGKTGAPGRRDISGIVNIAPRVEIDPALAQLRWEAGQRVELHLRVDDDEPPEPGKVEWTVEERRCLGSDCLYISLYEGILDSFDAPAAGDAESRLRLSVTYEDAAGLLASDTAVIEPNLVSLTVDSEVPDVEFRLGDQELATPYDTELARGSLVNLSAQPIQEIETGFYDVVVPAELVVDDSTMVEIGVNRVPWGFIDLRGEAGTFVSRSVAVNEEALNIVDLRSFVALDDWRPVSRQALLGSNATRLALSVLPDGRLLGRVVMADEIVNVESTEPVQGDGRNWVRFVFDFESGIAEFYTSRDDEPNHGDVTWTQLGTAVDTGNVGVILPISRLVIGQQNSVASRPLDGKVFAAAYLFNTSEVPVDFTDTGDLTSPPPNYSRWGSWTVAGDGWAYVAPPN
jgi:hypothetical protein